MATANRVGDLTYVDISVRVHTDPVWRDEFARLFTLFRMTDPRQLFS